MAADPIHVEVDEEVPAIIERIRRSPAEEVHLVVPPRARFGQSRFNFQLLRQYSTRLGKRVAIWSPDPVVQRMAEESGFAAFHHDPPPAPGSRPARPVAQPPAAPPRPPVRPPAREPLQPRRLLERAASFLPASMAPSAAAGAPAAGGPAAAAAPGLARIRIGAPRRMPAGITRYEPSRYVLYAGAAILLVVGVLAVLLYVPSATVTLVAQAQPFSIPVDITADPGKGAVHIRTASDSASDSQGGTATGNKVTPGQLATGQFTYVNGCPTALAVPNGQRLRSTSGALFAQVSGDVTVGQGQQATVDIKAVQSGQAGNVGAGQITGIDPNPYPCLTGTNQGPTTGGTDDQKQTVIQSSDIQSVKAALEQKLRQKIQTDLTNGIQKDRGETLAPVMFGQENFSTTHNVDDPSPTFTATLSLTAEGDYYVPAEVDDQFRQRLGAKVPAGQQLTTNKIPQTYTVTASPGGHMDFNGTANGYVAPRIDIDKVKGQLAGRPAASAHDVLSTLPIKSSAISQSPPLPLMPLSASRIYVDYGVQALPSAKSA